MIPPRELIREVLEREEAPAAVAGEVREVVFRAPSPLAVLEASRAAEDEQLVERHQVWRERTVHACAEFVGRVRGWGEEDGEGVGLAC